MQLDWIQHEQCPTCGAATASERRDLRYEVQSRRFECGGHIIVTRGTERDEQCPKSVVATLVRENRQIFGKALVDFIVEYGPLMLGDGLNPNEPRTIAQTDSTRREVLKRLRDYAGTFSFETADDMITMDAINEVRG